jgi:ABC-2 type transport system permease protein
MTLAVLRSMLLSLLRDRGSLALTFLLPVAFFLVFASIFGGHSGDSPTVTVAIADEGGTEATGRLARALAREPALDAVGADGKRVAAGAPLPALSGDAVRSLVRNGAADVGLILRKEAGSGDAVFGASARPPVVVVEDSAKGVASQIAQGLLQKTYFGAMPDVLASGGMGLFEDELGELTPAQREKFERGIASLRADALEADASNEAADSDFGAIVELEQVTGRSAGQNSIAYYAGAIAVMFLMLSAASTAAHLIEEKDAGILDRILAGPSGLAPLLRAKFLFLVLMGIVQIGAIFAVAWLLRGVDLPGHFAGWAIVTVAASAAAAGLALALTAASRTRRQAHAVSTIGILILSAIGGSMVPRFFMPKWIQDLGWITPNTWALEGYTRIFWRDLPLSSLAVPVGLLLAVGVGGFLVARILTRRWETL